MAVKRHKFLVSEGEIYQILFADDSDDETALQLDGEDLEFFGEDVDNVEAETDIEHPDKPGPSNPQVNASGIQRLTTTTAPISSTDMSVAKATKKIT